MMKTYKYILFFCTTVLINSFLLNEAKAFNYGMESNHSSGHYKLIAVNKSKEISDEEKKIISGGAENFVQSMAQRALDFLDDDDKTKKEQEADFKKLLSENFDMRTIGRFALGRYWRSSTKDEKKEYLTLFNDMVLNIYSYRFSEYKGKALNTIDSRTINKTDTLVMSKIILNKDATKKVKVEWLVRYKKDKYKIIDVVVEGISMSVTQRQDFSAVIQRGGGRVAVLIEHLKYD